MQREKEMEILPNDLMVQIFSRFPSKSVARFCTLSKHWASTFQSQEFAELFLARSSTRPRLLFAVDQYAYNRWQIFSTLQPQNQYEQSSHVDFHTKFSGDEEDFLAGLTKQLVDSSLENDFSGGFSGTHAVPACNDNKAWCVNRLAGTGCCCQNQKSNQNSGVSSWDLYCAMAEEVARMSITVKPYLTGRGLLDPPTKLSSAPLNHGTGYYNHHQQTLALQKLQAIQFQQLKQQQLMNQSRVSFHGNKNVGPMDLSSSAWSNQLPRRDVMRAVFLVS